MRTGAPGTDSARRWSARRRRPRGRADRRSRPAACRPAPRPRSPAHLQHPAGDRRADRQEFGRAPPMPAGAGRSSAHGPARARARPHAVLQSRGLELASAPPRASSARSSSCVGAKRRAGELRAALELGCACRAPTCARSTRRRRAARRPRRRRRAPAASRRCARRAAAAAPAAARQQRVGRDRVACLQLDARQPAGERRRDHVALGACASCRPRRRWSRSAPADRRQLDRRPAAARRPRPRPPSASQPRPAPGASATSRLPFIGSLPRLQCRDHVEAVDAAGARPARWRAPAATMASAAQA